MLDHQPLGEFEQMVLLCIMRLRGDAYGVSIREELRLHARRTVAPGALYTTLERLERKGLVASKAGPSTPERGGRAKRFYTVTSAGQRRIVEAQQVYRNLLAGLDIPEVQHG